MYKLNNEDLEIIISKLKQGEEIPQEYRDLLFPAGQKESELIYKNKMRKEDVLANEDGVFPVPLQVDKVFSANNCLDNWRNMIVFGDNLQFLKTVYENKDPLIKDKLKGKVKLIYIDPPFSTEKDFKGNKGQKAYSDKVNGVEFLEYIRRRLILAKEILAEDGSIYVHLDEKMSHYVKVIMDELGFVFQREIIWRIGWISGYKSKAKNWIRNHDVILFYTKSDNFHFNKEYIPYPEDYVRRDGKKPVSEGYPVEDTWNCNPLDELNSIQIISFSNEKIGYPTQKNESLISRIIKSSTKEGDIVLDFFAGSGTTAAVAEKLGRKWVTVDIGKFSYYTVQKRILTISNSKDIVSPAKKYNKEACSFITVNTGLYDLEKVFELQQEEYISFIKNLFEIETVDKKVNGIRLDGIRKDGFHCIIFPHWKFKDSAVDDIYLQDLYSHVEDKLGERIYIIAPINYIDFVSDYYEVKGTKFYFLKVPYHVIKELHKVQFKKMKQPTSQEDINNLVESVGFHFIKQPLVETTYEVSKTAFCLKVDKFLSSMEEELEATQNFETLSSVLIDTDYNDENFVMTEIYFRQNLKIGDTQRLEMSFDLNKIGNKMMFIYVDIYGNEFKEVIEIRR